MAKGVLVAVAGTSNLSVDVSELLRRPGATRHLQFRHVVEGLALPMARVREGDALDFDLRLESLVGGILVRGRVAGAVVVSCSRCLREVARDVAVDVNALFVLPGEGDDDTYDIVDERIDLEDAVRDDLLTALPLNPLCSDTCKGLCPECGVDRNEVDCGHTNETPDMRWEALRRLRESMEE